MTLDYFYGQSGELFSYFRIPKALFQDHRFRQLSTDARTLYGILLDRMSLSVKNGWLDEQGRVYIIYTVTVRYFKEDIAHPEVPAVGNYITLTGKADRIDPVFRTLQVGETVVPFEDLVEVSGEGIMEIDQYLGISEE